MIKTNERFEHGEHNEAACNYLTLNADFKDWVITTAFYSALHFVSSKIFPFKVSSIEGKQTSIENIDQYFNYCKSHKKHISKHELLLELVEKHFTSEETYECYDWLFSAATTARYSNYQYQVEISNRALTYLVKIKKACTSHPVPAKKLK